MDHITITLTTLRARQLKELATRYGLTPEELARVSVEELLSRPQGDFDRAAGYILEKNVDLYRRLAK